jgi:inhibitor of KinA sporulation pathway (predicted exonuclease)
VSEAAVRYVLPAALTGRADLARLVREIESVDGELEAQKVRAKGQKVAYRLPNMSRALSDFLDQNKLDVTDDQGRMELVEQLRKLKDHAPVVHMTFACDADPDSLQQLVTYMRRELHPCTLVSVGLQPRLVAGAYMRTPNHVHDFSVRKQLASKRDVITNDLEGLING